MVEFALVLPFLALLTFGTMEVALYLQQQSAINGAAFIAARSASVLGNDRTGTDKSLKAYTDATGMGWLQSASVKDESNVRGGLVGYSLTAGADRMSGVLSGLTQGKFSGFDKLGARAVMPLEWTASSYNRSYSPTSKPATLSTIEYPSNEDYFGFSGPGAAATTLQMAQQVRNIIEALKQQAAPAPTPKPTAKPVAGGSPGPKPTAAPVASPTPAPVALPDSGALSAIASGREPFSVEKAVDKNPRRRQDDGENGADESFQKRYIRPGYETDLPPAAPTRFKLQTLIDELRPYEDALGGPFNGKANIEQISSAVGTAVKAARLTAAGAALVQGAAKYVKEGSKSTLKAVDDRYEKVKKREEKELFAR